MSNFIWNIKKCIGLTERNQYPVTIFETDGWSCSSENEVSKIVNQDSSSKRPDTAGELICYRVYKVLSDTYDDQVHETSVYLPDGSLNGYIQHKEAIQSDLHPKWEKFYKPVEFYFFNEIHSGIIQKSKVEADSIYYTIESISDNKRYDIPECDILEVPLKELHND